MGGAAGFELEDSRLERDTACLECLVACLDLDEHVVPLLQDAERFADALTHTLRRLAEGRPS